jgi:dolichyl-phosphate-mannose-protein mannosyltransferase
LTFIDVNRMFMTKRDLAIVAVLSLAFFLIASWALGMYNVPVSTWQPSEGETFYIDFGSVKNVSAIYILLYQGSVSFGVYTGQPGGWDLKTTASIADYYHWEEVGIDDETQFVRFVFYASYQGEIAEISALGGDGKKIDIQTIKGENGEDKSLMKLIDEQEKVECPPTYQSETYFDEIYYVRTAEDYIHMREPYEWTQPPLGKLILAAGILVFNFNPFGWRISGVLFATLMIPVIYLLGKKMFGTWIGAFTPAFLLEFDFMHFTMARIATIDTFVVFFSLLSQLFFFIYLKNVLSQGWKASTRPLLVATIFFALGLATKWYALLGFLGQMFILFVLRLRELSTLKGWMARARGFFGRPFLSIVVFLVVGLGIYVLTYVPYMMIGHTLVDVYNAQWAMYNYHATLTATHPFSSPWWSWPLITRPVWLYVSNLPGGNVSTIAAMGNPAIWWVGLASMVFAAEEGIRKKNSVCLFLVTMFLFQWLPYAFISRILFLYVFYFNVPIMILTTTYFIDKSWNTRHGKVVVMAYLTVVAVLFAIFYPVISGIPVPAYWRDGLKWLRSWVF